MKLEHLKGWTLENINFVQGNVALDQNTLAVLAIDKDDKYCILIFEQEVAKQLELPYLKTFLESDIKPVLFSVNGKLGIVNGLDEIYFYTDIKNSPQLFPIKNKTLFSQVVPKTARTRSQNPISINNVLPICFEDNLYSGDARYFGFLDIDIDKKQAKWTSFSKIENKKFPYHKDGNYPPKLDSLLLRETDFLAFVPGGKTTSVNKWGMDYYALVKITKEGKVIDTLFDSGNLNKDQKKRGVNGIFTSTMEYVILTPVFQSDEWKGKQKLYSLLTKEFLEIEMPRGKSKYKLIQKSGDNFWIYMYDKNQKHFSICKEVEK